MDRALSSPQLRATESARIQAVRGVACLLLVAFHVIGGFDTQSAPLPNDSPFREFINLFFPIRMPLFAFLSGFVYAYRPMAPGSGRQFGLKKLRRLGLPLIVASTLMYVFDQAVALYKTRGEAVHFEPALAEIWKIYLLPFHQYWFLQVLIVIFGLLIVLESVRALSTLRRFLLVFVASLICLAFVPWPKDFPFSLPLVTYLLPYFLLGLGLNRFRTTLMVPAVRYWSVALFAASVTLHAYAVVKGYGDVTNRRTLVATFTGMSAATSAALWFPYPKLLQWIGRGSFSIFLYHMQFTVVSAFLLNLLGEPPQMVVFVIGLAAGILGPLAVERMAERAPATRMALLGAA
jgi:peptidoglycan/LPS O-acetylase OafA/YrhL